MDAPTIPQWITDPDRTLTFVPKVVTFVVSFALTAYATHLSTARELVFCLVYVLVTVSLMFLLGRWLRKRVFVLPAFEVSPPWRCAGLMLGIMLAFAVSINLVDRYLLAGFYLHNAWLDASNVRRFLDATLLVRVCVMLAVNGYFSAQRSYLRMTESLGLQAEALRHADEARRRQLAAETERQRAEVEARTAQQLATEAELTALKMQMNPHFLFNTLGSIAVLARLDGPRAGQMTEKLAEIFRYALQASKQPATTLGDEVEFLEAYFEIERARFGSRLSMTIDIPAELMSLRVPNLLLQPMVENAIAHAFSARCNGWKIAVRATAADGFAEIAVSDNGRGFDGRDPSACIGRGTALKNIDERLRRLHGAEARLIVEENQPRGAVFKIRVPLPAAIRA